MKIVFASQNQGKLNEVKDLLKELDCDLISLSDIAEPPEVIEDGKTFFANALKKARTIAEHTGLTALADDSGLAVDALQGAPGIYSSRYAGADADDLQNMEKLLHELKGVPGEKRGAAFHCVLVLYHPDGRYTPFEGKWEGRISEAMRGRRGFGYDPIFCPDQQDLTVAELPQEEKNRLSHRAQAMQKLKQHLEAMV